MVFRPGDFFEQGVATPCSISTSGEGNAWKAGFLNLILKAKKVKSKKEKHFYTFNLSYFFKAFNTDNKPDFVFMYQSI